MGVFNNQRFASNNQVYETPDELFLPLNKEFHFTLDVCADKENAKCNRFFDESVDGLKQDWDGVCWMNPPFKDVKHWVKKAYEESLRGVTVVSLVCAKTNTNWFHEYCLKGEVRFIKGRPKFKGMAHGLPFPLVIVVFRGIEANNIVNCLCPKGDKVFCPKYQTEIPRHNWDAKENLRLFQEKFNYSRS